MGMGIGGGLSGGYNGSMSVNDHEDATISPLGSLRAAAEVQLIHSRALGLVIQVHAHLMRARQSRRSAAILRTLEVDVGRGEDSDSDNESTPSIPGRHGNMGAAQALPPVNISTAAGSAAGSIVPPLPLASIRPGGRRRSVTFDADPAGGVDGDGKASVKRNLSGLDPRLNNQQATIRTSGALEVVLPRIRDLLDAVEAQADAAYLPSGVEATHIGPIASGAFLLLPTADTWDALGVIPPSKERDLASKQRRLQFQARMKRAEIAAASAKGLNKYQKFVQRGLLTSANFIMLSTLKDKARHAAKLADRRSQKIALAYASELLSQLAPLVFVAEALASERRAQVEKSVSCTASMAVVAADGRLRPCSVSLNDMAPGLSASAFATAFADRYLITQPIVSSANSSLSIPAGGSGIGGGSGGGDLAAGGGPAAGVGGVSLPNATVGMGGAPQALVRTASLTSLTMSSSSGSGGGGVGEDGEPSGDSMASGGADNDPAARAGSFVSSGLMHLVDPAVLYQCLTPTALVTLTEALHVLAKDEEALAGAGAGAATADRSTSPPSAGSEPYSASGSARRSEYRVGSDVTDASDDGRSPSPDRHRSRSRGRDKDRERERERDGDYDESSPRKERRRDRDRDRDRDRGRDRDRDREYRSRDRNSSRGDRDRERDSSRTRSSSRARRGEADVDVDDYDDGGSRSSRRRRNRSSLSYDDLDDAPRRVDETPNITRSGSTQSVSGNSGKTPSAKPAPLASSGLAAGGAAGAASEVIATIKAAAYAALNTNERTRIPVSAPPADGAAIIRHARLRCAVLSLVQGPPSMDDLALLLAHPSSVIDTAAVQIDIACRRILAEISSIYTAYASLIMLPELKDSGAAMDWMCGSSTASSAPVFAAPVLPALFASAVTDAFAGAGDGSDVAGDVGVGGGGLGSARSARGLGLSATKTAGSLVKRARAQSQRRRKVMPSASGEPLDELLLSRYALVARAKQASEQQQEVSVRFVALLCASPGADMYLSRRPTHSVCCLHFIFHAMALPLPSPDVRNAVLLHGAHLRFVAPAPVLSHAA